MGKTAHAKPRRASGSNQKVSEAATQSVAGQASNDIADSRTRQECLDHQGITDYSNQLKATNAHHDRGQDGPLKRAMAHSDSLYKFISWEDPLRTLGSYIGALSLLFGLHYFPLTKLALKASATALGTMSIVSFVSKSFKSGSTPREVPREYRRAPEDTLNATLKDIHDFIQYFVVEIQRILFGEDFNKTCLAFISTTILYWFIKVMPPFWVSVFGLTSVYLATFIASPQGRGAAHSARVRTKGMANTVVQTGKQIAQGGTHQLATRVSKARETAFNVGRRSADTVQGDVTSTKDQIHRAPGNAPSPVEDGTRLKNDIPSGETGNALDESDHDTAPKLSGSHPSTISDLQDENMGSSNLHPSFIPSDTTTYDNQDTSSENLVSNTDRLPHNLGETALNSGMEDEYTYMPGPNSILLGHDYLLESNYDTGESTPRSASTVNSTLDRRLDVKNTQAPATTGSTSTV